MIDWSNDDLFFTYSFEDETSPFDPKARWSPGGDCYFRTYKCRVPIAFKDSYEMTEKFVDFLLFECPDSEAWVE